MLLRAVERAAGGHGSVVCVVGDHGIGKSALMASVAHCARDKGVTVATGRAGSLGDATPYRPVAEALLDLARRGVTADRLGPYQQVLGTLVPDWVSDGLPPASSAMLIGEGVLRLFASVGSGLLILEDLDSVDPDTLAVFEYVADNVATLPVCVIATVRPGRAQTEAAIDALERRGAVARINLDPLGPADLADMIAAHFELPTASVDASAVTWLSVASGGNPYFAHELLVEAAADGNVRSTDGAIVMGRTPSVVPDPVVRYVRSRLDGLDDDTHETLLFAALLGQRFSAAVVRSVATSSAVDDHLHAAVSARVISPGQGSDDYEFTHQIVRDAILHGLGPTRRSTLARQLVDALEHSAAQLSFAPSLLGDLWLAAGDRTAAAQCYLRAAREQLPHGALRTAAVLAFSALDACSPADHLQRADILQVLLWVVTETGDFGDLPRLRAVFDDLLTAPLPGPLRAQLLARMAGVEQLSGDNAAAVGLADRAQAALGESPHPEAEALVAVVAAAVELGRQSADRIDNARHYAQSAVTAAARAKRPALECEAHQLLGALARQRDLSESTRHLRRAIDIAREHHLTVPAIAAETFQAGTDILVNGEPEPMQRARRHASRAGIVPYIHEIDGVLALHDILTGEHDRARENLERSTAEARRLRLGRALPYLHAVQAVAAAHRGDQAGVDSAERRLRELGDEGQAHASLVHGLGRAVGRLLDEDRAAAREELDRAARIELDRPGFFCLTGRSGLSLLLGTLEGTTNAAALRAALQSAEGHMRWNRQFLFFADVVLRARAGDADGSRAALREALAAADRYPLGRFLGDRLIAEVALDEGWGEPLEWLRGAEDYFHRHNYVFVASRCRSMLRNHGAVVQQRRDGSGDIPAALRAAGVTVREYEVYQVLAERLGNKQIADRLFISPRTVEKHVASLVQKLQAADRGALCQRSQRDQES